MSKVPGIMKTEDVIGKQTLVRRVSNMLKDGSSGPPMLFRHASMQRIRHCCQNLNLFPYLLYSFDNSTSHPIALKVHLCLSNLLQGIMDRIFFLYKNLWRSLLRSSPDDSLTQEYVQPEESCEPRPRFQKPECHKRKQHPTFLTIAVYFAPFLLVFQSIGLFGLMIFCKYTPGYIFLVAALLLLGFIWMKILFHESVRYTKIESEKYEKNKVD
ncbi:uncharacterized protein LOC128886149 [Hylaeus anthracinus]|uniref:uncharacterized protein LOC128886149 n=1 Tax=Hylaeus anthracinus TaxID=313031 RepID=UPI0023B90601|nr:uncharacterized protein LOC128886149 [Hylaeus anthracinus]XP_053996749.1 uncharacterized protein LOC128886149 [Hylaeus anthracinus]XP_053996750.1 uncharacterized protein LOC128886149 [Hylaeus anthracinus]